VKRCGVGRKTEEVGGTGGGQRASLEEKKMAGEDVKLFTKVSSLDRDLQKMVVGCCVPRRGRWILISTGTYI
jgi:hypothetical protein